MSLTRALLKPKGYMCATIHVLLRLIILASLKKVSLLQFREKCNNFKDYRVRVFSGFCPPIANSSCGLDVRLMYVTLQLPLCASLLKKLKNLRLLTKKKSVSVTLQLNTTRMFF